LRCAGGKVRIPKGQMMSILRTERLELRPFRGSDAADLARLLADRAIAEMTLRIPHPYTLADAESWIASQPDKFASGKSVVFASTLRDSGALIGAFGLDVDRAHDRAELGYWIGRPYWNNGYGTEAAREVVRYGFEVLGLNRIFAGYFTRNVASGRIQERIGFRREGVQAQHIKKWDRYEDVVMKGILRGDFLEGRGGVTPHPAGT
jgi:[ribosomal protein S5]-alanine N-acetyltransferase